MSAEHGGDVPVGRLFSPKPHYDGHLDSPPMGTAGGRQIYYNPTSEDEQAYLLPSAEEQRRYFVWERHVAEEWAAQRREDERTEKISALLKNLDLHGKSVRGEIPDEELIVEDEVENEDGQEEEDPEEEDKTEEEKEVLLKNYVAFL